MSLDESPELPVRAQTGGHLDSHSENSSKLSCCSQRHDPQKLWDNKRILFWGAKLVVTQCIENEYTLHKCSTILLSKINIQAPGGGSGETTNYVNQI